MADQKKKIDPFDVEALEKSLNDSATRVSTIWVSFLIFSLYLLTAATTVTHRQLFLAEPLKLPVLNIDLPLWGFFFLAPILFVVLHAYVLLQVILLARTADAYNAAVSKVAARDDLSPEENASLRQRLANTLFAQILAGSPREREGAFGWLLNAMAWITLAIAPILILLTFQFMFLPYHSHLATWTHRLLILLEFVLAFQFWPLVLKPERDFQWPNFRWRVRESARHLVDLLRPSGDWQNSLQGLRPQAIPLASAALFVLISLSLASFPGEPHVNLASGNELFVVRCDRWFAQKFDRLELPRLDVVDDEKLDKIASLTLARGQRPFEGERTRNLRERDLSCGNFTAADLRRVDLTDARLSGARLDEAELAGASLSRTNLKDASLFRAHLQSAFLGGAQLQAADLRSADLQGMAAYNARFQGADMTNANLQGATLHFASLQGAIFDWAKSQGAVFDSAFAQYASFNEANLQGSSMSRAHLQGLSLIRSDLTRASIVKSFLWLAGGQSCSGARVISPNLDPILELRRRNDSRGNDVDEGVSAISKQAVANWVEEIAAELPPWKRQSIRSRFAGLREEADWAVCWDESEKISEEEFDRELVSLLRDIACNATIEREHVAHGIIQNWTVETERSSAFKALLASSLLSMDGKECFATKNLGEVTKERLRGLVRTSLPPSGSGQ